MYRKHLCTKCQAELPPEAPVKPQKRKSKYRDSHYFNAPYETYQDIKKVPQADRYVPVVDQNGDYVMATYRRAKCAECDQPAVEWCHASCCSGETACCASHRHRC